MSNFIIKVDCLLYINCCLVVMGFLYRITSGLCCFLFIFGIFQLSVVHYIYKKFLFDNKDKLDNLITKKDAYPVPIKEIKIIDNLDYYAQLLGLKIVEYEIVTEDGFIIILQRLYNPKKSKEEINSLKPILLLHGLMQSSGSFLTSGFKSLAYFYVSNDYDVWLGNNRCGFNPKHIHYSKNDSKMWDWDLHEMITYDIPSMIDHIIDIKKGYYSGKISITAHSQGTTQIVNLISRQFNSNYVNYIDKCILLAPAVYGGPLLNDKLFIKFMRLLPNSLYSLFFGHDSFMPILMQLRKFTYKLPSFGLTSYMVFSYLFEWNDNLWDPEIRRFHFIFSPVYVSVNLMKWWLRGNVGFAMNKPIINDPNSWFSRNSPDLFLLVGGKDDLVNGDLFLNRLFNIEGDMKGRWNYVKIDEYSHLDVLWADDLLERVGGALLEFLRI